MLNIADKAAPVLDTDEYPTRWVDYIGQTQAKTMLQIAAKSARVRKETLDHTLIAHGTPGVGKTALAALIAAEMKTTVRVVSGQLNKDMARLLFSGMSDGDILFYDEFHQVMDGGKKKAEWLLTYLQDGYISGPLGPEEQPRVTVIAATTDAGKIPENITSRFLLRPPMVDYTPEEAAKIVTVMSAKVLGPAKLPKVTGKEASAIAAAAHGNPRAIKRMLTVLRDMTVAKALPLKKGRYDVDGLLAFQGITADGLDASAQRYLKVMAEEFHGTAGAKPLEDRLQIPGGLGGIERALMDQGLLAKTRTGRTLTQAGIRRYRELVAA